MTSRHLHTIGGLIFALIGVALIYGSMRLPYYTSIGPGPGFFPFWLSVLLLLLGSCMAIGASKSIGTSLALDFWPDRKGASRMLAVALSLVFAALGLDRLGFPISMMFVNLILLFVLGLRRPLILILTALLGSFGVYLVFHHLLMVELPSGLLPI